jgi:hypothetical protein
MKGKIILLSVLIFIFASCTETHVEVRIPMKRPDTVSFDQYEHILVGDFAITVSPETVAVPISVTDFFIKDFAKFIDRDIEYLKTGEEEGQSPQGNALLITGTLKTEIKERNRIKETRNKFGDKIRSFVKVQNWTMKMDIRLVESASGQAIKTFNFEDRLKDSENVDSEFNFTSLFNRITDRFIQKVIRKESYQKRYLLLR